MSRAMTIARAATALTCSLATSCSPKAISAQDVQVGIERFYAARAGGADNLCVTHCAPISIFSGRETSEGRAEARVVFGADSNLPKAVPREFGVELKKVSDGWLAVSVTDPTALPCVVLKVRHS